MHWYAIKCNEKLYNAMIYYKMQWNAINAIKCFKMQKCFNWVF